MVVVVVVVVCVWCVCGDGFDVMLTRDVSAPGHGPRCTESQAMLQTASPRKAYGHLVTCDPDLTLPHEARSPQAITQVNDGQTPDHTSSSWNSPHKVCHSKRLKKKERRTCESIRDNSETLKNKGDPTARAEQQRRKD